MILITGIGGFIGMRMAQIFTERNIEFTGIDYKETDALPGIIKMDVRDTAVEKLMKEKNVDSIIHMAFCTNPKMEPALRRDIDINGSKNIINSALKCGIKDIVFASSERVYGDLNGKGGIYDRERNYLNPADDSYARDKVEAEDMFLNAAEKEGLNVAIMRFAIVCFRGGGPGMGDMIKSTSKNGRFMKLRGKNPPIQLVHVDDVIDWCYNAIGKNGIFDIGAEDRMSLTEIYSYAAEMGGKKASPINLPEKPVLFLVGLLWKLGLSPIPPLFVKLLGYDFFRDVSKTVNTLGKPKYGTKDIISEILSQ